MNYNHAGSAPAARFASEPLMSSFLRRFCRLAALPVVSLGSMAWLAVPSPAQAATVTASSCALAAVQSAVDGARDGDTVVIPAGTCTWGGALNINASTRNLQVRGAGEGSTTINAAAAPVLSINGAQGYQWRFSDVSFNIQAGGQEVVSISGTSKTWRFHNATFRNTGAPLFVFTIRGDTYGLLDHLTVSGANSGIVSLIGGGFASWTNPAHADWGTERAVYLEDSVITMSDHNEGRLTIDCTNGGRYVLRNNTITNQRTGNHGLDTGGYASCVSGEIYSNRFIYSWPTISGVVFWRGGSTLVHNNRFEYASSTWGSNHLTLLNFRAGDGTVGWPACNGARYAWSSSVTPSWGGSYSFSTGGTQRMCSGNRMRLCTSDSTCAANGEGTCSEYVDGQQGSGSYPCFMQVGRGVNNMPNPSYAWGNTFRGGAGAGGFSCPAGGCAANTFSAGTNIQANRDFFNGTARPGYTPYAYPHPLQSGASGGTPPPAPAALPPPSGLRVQ